MRKQGILTRKFEVSPWEQSSPAQSVHMIHHVDWERKQSNHNVEEILFLSRKYFTILEVSISSPQMKALL